MTTSKHVLWNKGGERKREREVDLVELFSDLVLVNRFLKLTVPVVERYSYLLKTRLFFLNLRF